MTFDQLVPIVEGKLYHYAVLQLEYPAARISSAYQDVVASGGETSTEPERWVVQHQSALMDAAVIDRVLRQLPEQERAMVRLRYLERHSMATVAEALHVCRREAYRVRDRVISVLAYEYGLLYRPPENLSPCGTHDVL